jgi:hypothetical protein
MPLANKYIINGHNLYYRSRENDERKFPFAATARKCEPQRREAGKMNPVIFLKKAGGPESLNPGPRRGMALAKNVQRVLFSLPHGRDERPDIFNNEKARRAPVSGRRGRGRPRV